jgi:hypothetical protein
MKYLIVFVLIFTSAVFAKPSQKEQKLIKDTAESIGIELSFSREVTSSNIEEECLKSFIKKSPGLAQSDEIRNMAKQQCASEWKSLQ